LRVKAMVFIGSLLFVAVSSVGSAVTLRPADLRNAQVLQLTSKPPPITLVDRHLGILELAAGVVKGGRFARKVVVDDGELVISPPGSRVSPRISLTVATKLIDESLSTYGVEYYRPEAPALAVVTIASREDPHRRFDGRLAWVAISSPGPTDCIVQAPSPAHATYRFPVVLLGAKTAGDLVIYLSRGILPCDSTIAGPSYLQPREAVSVASKVIGERPVANEPGYVDWIIRYRIPACGTLLGPGWDGGTQARPRVLVGAYLPVPRPAKCALETRTVSFGPESVPWTRVTTVSTDILQYRSETN
jgi:hypothetical protein